MHHNFCSHLIVPQHILPPDPLDHIPWTLEKGIGLLLISQSLDRFALFSYSHYSQKLDNIYGSIIKELFFTNSSNHGLEKLSLFSAFIRIMAAQLDQSQYFAHLPIYVPIL